jgi:hypothetical protein
MSTVNERDRRNIGDHELAVLRARGSRIVVGMNGTARGERVQDATLTPNSNYLRTHPTRIGWISYANPSPDLIVGSSSMIFFGQRLVFNFEHDHTSRWAGSIPGPKTTTQPCLTMLCLNVIPHQFAFRIVHVERERRTWRDQFDDEASLLSRSHDQSVPQFHVCPRALWRGRPTLSSYPLPRARESLGQQIGPALRREGPHGQRGLRGTRLRAHQISRMPLRRTTTARHAE